MVVINIDFDFIIVKCRELAIVTLYYGNFIDQYLNFNLFGFSLSSEAVDNIIRYIAS